MIFACLPELCARRTMAHGLWCEVGGIRRRVKDGTILKSTFFGALVLRMGTFGMRKIRHGGD
jgi:hypothetical protein